MNAKQNRSVGKVRARQWHFGALARSCHRSESRNCRSVFDLLDRERDFAAENFYTISTDTHIDHLVILLIILFGGANKNAAGTVHLRAPARSKPARRSRQRRAPPSRRRSIRRRNRWRDRLRCKKSCGRGGGPSDRRFRGKQSRRTFRRCARDIRRRRRDRGEASHRLQRAQRDHGKRNAGGNSLDGRRIVEISGCQTGETCDGARVVDGAEFGILLRHFSEDGLRRLLR